MGDKTGIEWTDATWNPVRGCAKVSSGCDNCYAMRQAARMDHPGGAYEGLTRRLSGRPQWNGSVRLVPELLTQPIRWSRPRRIFVNSMSDLFHPDVPYAFIDQVFSAMALSPHHTFQILTKRPERMYGYLSDESRLEAVTSAARELVHARPDALPGPFRWPLPNVWVGVSVEDQVTANERVPYLLRSPAAVRWISAEPLLGPVDLSEATSFKGDLGAWNGIDWVVAGGESGPGSRPAHADWFRAIRDYCIRVRVPFCFKQWGDWIDDYNLEDCPIPLNKRQDPRAHYPEHLWPGDGSASSMHRFSYRTGKRVAGRCLDGRIWDEYPGEQ